MLDVARFVRGGVGPASRHWKFLSRATFIMHIVFGTHQFGRRTIAYRGDFCLSCDRHTISQQQRTFNVFHLYWIPLLPLGFRRHWHCIECRNDPHARVQTSQGIKILGLCAFLFFAGVSWMVPMTEPGDAPIVWSLRVVMTGLALVFTALVFHHKPNPTLAEKMGQIPRFAPQRCLACGAPLDEAVSHCPQCDVEYL